MEPTRTPDSTGRRARRRGSGEGSIHKRPDGLWIGRLMVGTRGDGRPDRRSVSGHTRSEVQRKLIALRTAAINGRLADKDLGSTTVEVFFDRWLSAIGGSVRVGTWGRYAQVAKLHIVPALGRRKLSDLRPHHLQQLYSDKAQSGLSPRTVQYIHATLRRALGMAVKWDTIPRNVALDVEAPRVPKREIHPPAPADLTRLIDSALDHQDRLAVFWTVAIYSGARLGEVLALQWADVDFEEPTISIRRGLERVQGTTPIFSEPKSASSRRRIALPPEAIEALRRHRVEQNQERLRSPYYADYDLVFCTHLGTPLGARNVQRDFKRALDRAGLPLSVRFHDLRHAHATAMLAAGVHVKTASARLGHSQVAITLDLYSHALPQLDRDAANVVADLIRRA